MKRTTISKFVFLAGFLLLLSGVMMMVTIPCSVMRSHSSDLRAEVTYSAKDVHEIIYASGNDIVKHQPWLVLSVSFSLMLVALLIMESGVMKSQQPPSSDDLKAAPEE